MRLYKYIVAIIKKIYNLLSSPTLLSSFTICVLLVCVLLICLWSVWLWLVWEWLMWLLSSMIETKEPFNFLASMRLISTVITVLWVVWFSQTMKESFNLFMHMLETTEKLFNSLMRTLIPVINKVWGDREKRKGNVLQQKMQQSATFWIWVILATMYEMKQIKTGHRMNKGLSAFWLWIFAHASESWFFWIYSVLILIVWALVLLILYYGEEDPIIISPAKYPASCALYLIVGFLTVLFDYSDRSWLISVAHFFAFVASNLDYTCLFLLIILDIVDFIYPNWFIELCLFILWRLAPLFIFLLVLLVIGE